MSSDKELNSPRERTATIISKIHAASDVVELIMEINEGREAAMLGSRFSSPLPGQFAHIAVPGSFLRRPLSVAGFDDESGRLRIIVRRAGKGSSALASLPVGSSLNLLFPLGNPFPMELIESFGKVWIVAGGIGLAPLLFAARRASQRRLAVRSFVGFRDDTHVFGVEELEEYGPVSLVVGGVVTERLSEVMDREAPGLIFACGPAPMLGALRLVCAPRGVRAFVSLEERMGCGVGACLVCNCGIKSPDGFAYKRVCADGPVFDISEVGFE
ncbi:MAG: dihydroorotate dehydrogenase electron transfer subunit [Synergistaceae bacterium]|jgi:dihydroorotate dehydrogenase electron transfer subunit|nr:dihydroorotate dehydrogenase electron transfer subunit [Synergistaceae bacterium]